MNFNQAKIINVYYNKGDRKPYDINGKPIAYIGEEFVGATEATTLRFHFGEDLDSSTATIVTKRADGERRLDICTKVGTGATSYYEVTLNDWYGAVKGKAVVIFKAYNGSVTFDNNENPTEIISVSGRIVVSDIFNLDIAYAPVADLVVPPDTSELYEDWFFALSTKLDKADSITVAGALPTLTGDVYDDRYFYIEDEGVGRLYYINGSTAVEVVWQVGTLKLTATGNGELTADTGKLSFDASYGGVKFDLYNNVYGHVGQDLHYYGKASVAITKGQVVQFAGVQGDHYLIKPAVASEINANPKLIMGLALQDIDLNAFGYVSAFGRLIGVDTVASGFAVGDLLWFNSTSATDGLLTKTQPTGTNAKVLLAVVVKEETGGSNNGVLLVRTTIEPKLDELQNVLLNGQANGDVLSYDGTKWVNSTRLSTAETDISNIEDGTTIVAKANADKDGNEFDATYLKKATATSTYVPLSSKGVANGVAPLGSDNKIPSIHLPGGVDDIKEFADLASFPATGEASIIYVALDTNKIYRWSGSSYVEIVSSVALGTTSSTAFPGDRGLAVETLADNIVDGTQTLTNTRITNSAVGTNPLIVNAISSTTANLANFQFAGANKLEITKDGFLTQNGTRLFTQTGADTNTFFGLGSGGTSTSGIQNTSFGRASLTNLTSGSNNTAIGRSSLFNLTSSSGNTSIGSFSGNSITTGSNNTFIGVNAGNDASQLATASNSTAIGNGSYTNVSNQMVFGNASVSEILLSRKVDGIKVGIGTTTPALIGFGNELTLSGSGFSGQQVALFNIQGTTLVDGNIGALSFFNSTTRIGSIAGARSGADNSGRLVFNTATTGSLTEKMTILPNGNVGIGTTSPAHKLHISGAGSQTLRIENTNTTIGLGDIIGSIQFNSNDASNGGTGVAGSINSISEASTGVNYGLGFNTKTFSTEVERMRITNDGNVGIGTTSPTAKLEITGSTSTAGDTTLHLKLPTGNVTAGTTEMGNILFSSTDASGGGTGLVAKISTIAGDGTLAWTGDGRPTDLAFFTQPLGASASLVEAMRIDQNGNVGIGTTSPTAQLQVNSGATTRVPLIVDTLASHTANLQEWRVNNALRSRIAEDGSFIGSFGYFTSILNLAPNNARIFLNNTGTVVQRNIADTNPALIVNLENASATGNIQVWQKAGSALAFVDNAGYFRAPGIRGTGSTNNSQIDTATTGTIISRNINDSNPALRVNLANASATGDILKLQKAGTDVYAFTHDGTLKAPATFTIDPSAHGDTTGKVVILGDLQVDGTTTTINSTTLEVDDKNIELSKGATNKTASDGAGISIDLGTDGTANLTYGATNDRFGLNKGLEITSGNVGIGTTSPISRLEVSGTISANGKNLITSDGTSNYLFTQANLYIQSASGGSTLGVITSAGNVGIGTTSPSAQLQVKSGATNRVPLIVDTLASHAESLQVWRSNASNVSRVSVGGFYVGSGIHNLSSANNSLINNDTTGTTISRNIADTNPALIVNLANASATGNIQVWQKAGTAQATITNAGGATFKRNVTINGDSTTTHVLQVNATSGQIADPVQVSTGGNVRFTIQEDGDVYNLNGTYGTISDIRVKENVENARSYTEDLMKLRVVKYSLKEEQQDKPTHLGFIAQEVEEVFPSMVSTTERGEIKDLKQIKLSVLIPMLVKTIQEQEQRIKELEAKL